MSFFRHDLAHAHRPALAVSLLLLAFSGSAGCAASHHDDATDGGTTRVDAGAIAVDAGGSRVDAGGSLPDAGHAAVDAGAVPVCEAQDVSSAACPDRLCDGPPTWYWAGDRCVAIECGACEGSDCRAGWSSLRDCEAAHATCEPEQCRTTGGQWLWWVEECQHYECGRPVPGECVYGHAVCDCGTDRRFAPGMGCVPAPCPEPLPASREVMCRSTGGSWDAICCDTVCGELCPLACASPACNCGPGRSFDPARGCVLSAACHERTIGQSCSPTERCAPNALCCARCTGIGCGPAECIAPVCDADPNTDACGNDPRVP